MNELVESLNISKPIIECDHIVLNSSLSNLPAEDRPEFTIACYGVVDFSEFELFATISFNSAKGIGLAKRYPWK